MAMISMKVEGVQEMDGTGVTQVRGGQALNPGPELRSLNSGS